VSPQPETPDHHDLGSASPEPGKTAVRDIPPERDRRSSDDPVSVEARDMVAEARDVVAQARDMVAHARDMVAQAHDRMADARDKSAEARDKAAGVVDERAASDRAVARKDRQRAASDRALAATDREAARLDRAVAAAERLTYSMDGLTGAYLRVPGFVELDREMARARRTEQPLVLAFVDVDGLKAVNDSRGHAAGDRMLVEVAHTLARQMRPYDLMIRYGGDEFVCVLSGLDLAAAAMRLSSLNDLLAQAPERGSITVGLAEMEPDDSPEDLLVRADLALYRKRHPQQDALVPEAPVREPLRREPWPGQPAREVPQRDAPIPEPLAGEPVRHEREIDPPRGTTRGLGGDGPLEGLWPNMR
jgi:diguanylate cyclase (GGDEF)-like protein